MDAGAIIGIVILVIVIIVIIFLIWKYREKIKGWFKKENKKDNSTINKPK